MATVSTVFCAEHALFRTSGGATPTRANGTSIPVWGVAFDDAISENMFFRTVAVGYGSGNLTLDVYWYADTDTNSAHGVVWEAAIAAVTPGDAQDLETDAVTASTQNATGNPSTTSNGLVKTTITISNLDSLAANDYLLLRIARLVANVADDTTGDAIVCCCVLSYSDT